MLNFSSILSLKTFDVRHYLRRFLERKTNMYENWRQSSHVPSPSTLLWERRVYHDDWHKMPIWSLSTTNKATQSAYFAFVANAEITNPHHGRQFVLSRSSFELSSLVCTYRIKHARGSGSSEGSEARDSKVLQNTDFLVRLRLL